MFQDQDSINKIVMPLTRKYLTLSVLRHRILTDKLQLKFLAQDNIILEDQVQI